MLNSYTRYIASRPDYFVTLIASTKTGLETWRDFTERIHLVCHGVWEAVRDTLCFDAPEGLELDEEEADDNDLGTKDALSFCWRALKESRFALLSLSLESSSRADPDRQLALARHRHE